MSKNYYWGLYVLLIAFILSIYPSFNVVSMLIVCFFLICDISVILIVRYRIKKGYYGTNEYESRELIKEVIDKNKKQKGD